MLRRLAAKLKHFPRSALLLHGKSAAKLSTTSSSNVPDNKSGDEDDADNGSNLFGASFANRLNHSIDAYPLETIGTMVSLELVTIYGTYNMLNFLSIDFSAEFVFAFAASRVIRRFRLPVEILVAKGMKTLLPALSTVRILDLYSNPLKTNGNSVDNEKTNANNDNNNSSSSSMSFFRKSATYLYNTINEYGLCYTLSSRLVGVFVVFGIYESILLGIDINPIIEYFGIEKFGDVLGTWAGAVTLSSSLYPLSLYAASHIAPYVGAKRQSKQ